MRDGRGAPRARRRAKRERRTSGSGGVRRGVVRLTCDDMRFLSCAPCVGGGGTHSVSHATPRSHLLSSPPRRLDMNGVDLGGASGRRPRAASRHKPQDGMTVPSPRWVGDDHTVATDPQARRATASSAPRASSRYTRERGAGGWMDGSVEGRSEDRKIGRFHTIGRSEDRKISYDRKIGRFHTIGVTEVASA